MLLDRIDIDVHGPLHRVELGPFSEHLNVVCGPHGSGKTAIARFVRDSLVDRQYPLGMMSSSTGRIVWADREGIVHCRREKDGTAHGRTSVDFEPRGDFTEHFGHLRHSWISNVCNTSDRSRATAAIELPESLVDGVITDTAVTNLSRVLNACVRSGLDTAEAIEALPFTESHVSHRDGTPSREHDQILRRQLAEVEAEISRLGTDANEYDALIERRRLLDARLADHRHEIHPANFDQPSAQRRLTKLCELARDLRARQSELRRALVDSRRDGSAEYSSYRRHASVDGGLRRELDDLDAQIIGWRRTLLEVRGLRETIVNGHRADPSFVDPISQDEAGRRRRLDGLLNSVDRYDRARVWDHDGRSRWPLNRSEDIRDRIDSATRQIDWLLDRYAASDSVDRNWYDALPASASYRATTTLGDTLRAIRRDLKHVQQSASVPTHDRGTPPSTRQLDELVQCERWLVTAIDQLQRHRDSASYRRPAVNPQLPDVDATHHATRSAELDRVNSDLDACLAEAAEIRRTLRSPDASLSPEWVDREAIQAELRRIEERLAGLSRWQWLQVRKSQLLGQLKATERSPVGSPLAEAASHWLVRLSGGRLQRIHWPRAGTAESGSQLAVDGSIRIDGREEFECPAVDRALAVLAVRMAAGDLLAGMGRQVPLLLETHRDLLSDPQVEASGSYATAQQTYLQRGSYGRANHPLVAALQDYARAGRQVVLLTSDQELESQIVRAGGRPFRLQPQQVVHPHRPIWRPQYEAERYVGPHPHTYGNATVPHSSDVRPIVDINRDFDVAWREAYGLHDTVEQPAAPSPRTDLPVAGTEHRDGYYFADSYTTVTPQAVHRFNEQGTWSAAEQPATTASTKVGVAPVPTAGLHQTVPESPFFLSVDSPIDQAPSVDAVAAARLRGLSVTHINHLMQQDSNRLADALGLASVNAATLRRWQAECRLMCRVPQLRGFDARILVGCGVSDPAQLASIHPVDLLQEVEAFLATDRGQKILLSGSSHELSRITSWIAAANSSPAERAAASARNGDRSVRRAFDHRESLYTFDRDRYSQEEGTPRRTRRSARTKEGRSGLNQRGERPQKSTGTGRTNRPDSGDRPDRSVSATQPASSQPRRSAKGRRTRAEKRSRRNESDSRDVVRYRSDASPQPESEQNSETQSNHVSSAETRPWRFYLERDSIVEEAPSIGARMAERLNAIGIQTVSDLLDADPETVASELEHRRVDSDMVLRWQQQAELVCRVPMLRGHDAQLLVIVDVTTPEELAECDVEDLFAQIDPISRSKEGSRILRGGKMPDLQEVTDWISFAQHTRELRAA